jgi:hypothetical protein
MRRTRRAFRPAIGEVLEDRAVPSTSGLRAALGVGFGSFIGSVPAQDARQVQQAFGTFQRTYTQNVRSILLPIGTTNPSANRAAFDRATATALQTLNVSIANTVANLPTGSTLAQTIQAELIGGGANTLQSMLLAIPSPANPAFRTVRNFTQVASADINQAAFTVSQQVRSSQSPSASISQQTVQQDQRQVQAAIRTFSQTYTSDVRTILLPAGTANPSANRAAFDQAVGNALVTLNTSIDSALSNLPSSLTTTLDATIKNDLLSSGATPSASLQSRLAALQSPTSTQSLSVRVFQFGSSLTISNAQSQINRDILIAVSQFNLNGA